MAKSSLVVTLRLDGARDVIRAFRDLPKDANNELRNASLALAETLAPKVAAAGRSEGRQAALLAGTVKAQRDRVPVIVAGGTRRLGRNRKPAFKLLFGSEFGANFYRQFKPHLGSGSYWIFRTVDDEQPRISREWNKAADRVIRRWAD
ncbi:hypothetical protein O7626_31380 [Micromonospora sp. WMMD1102]|uniref:hypothetical protein n=1 Tax=Micromonospora sp. WMMD1102 TaxID=3016105 RepID=UPI002415441A|nr:hypothetical protein [Micromonospora sp. WMMD1102]MDG4790371.1 hypothetical protein [Micromonospora sp. WMMD1102]